MTDKQLEQKIKKLLAKFDDVNTYYIEKVAAQIREIGELTASTINVVAVMASMYDDIREINERIAEAAEKTIPELYQVYETAMNDVYKDDRFVRALEETPLPERSKEMLEHFAESVSRQTAEKIIDLSNASAKGVTEGYQDAVNKAVLTVKSGVTAPKVPVELPSEQSIIPDKNKPTGTFENLSNTTVIQPMDYVSKVDKSILAVSSGMGSYNEWIRKSLIELGSSGIQVEYESGYKRRLDTALRQNIIDGAKQIQQHASDLIGEELGYDAKEITAHLNSAPDHEPVQGHIFLNAEFDKLQTEQDSKDIDGNTFPAMRRPIGEWNCMHFAYAFSTKYSVRKYKPEELQEWIDNNHKGCDINGKHYDTLYDVTQLMRQIETDVRRQKDIAIAAKAAGDDELQQRCQRKINRLTEQYSDVVDKSGLYARRERMVVHGFNNVKVR